MSIASFFGNNVYPPPKNGQIVYANENNEVNIVKLLANNVAAASDDMVLGNVAGVAEWRLLEGGGEAIVPTLAEVMEQSPIVGADLDMSTFNITSPGVLNLVAASGIGFDATSDAGQAGQVVVSQGANAPPAWTTISVSDLPLTGDLDVSGFGLVDCATITNTPLMGLAVDVAAGVNITGVTTFANVPVCATDCVSSSQLANKSYVDTTLAAANGVTVDTANTFTALNTFTAGANIQITGADYNATNSSVNAYHQSGAAQPSLITQTTVWSFVDAADGSWNLPDPGLNLGAILHIIQGSTSNCTLHVYGSIQNLEDNQNLTPYSGCNFQQGGMITLIAFNGGGGYHWGLSFHSTNVSFAWE
jgi:hypothetical protein